MGRHAAAAWALFAAVLCLHRPCLAAGITHKQAGAAVQEGKAVCDGPVWTGATQEQLLTGAQLPDVQCNREPPCVRWSWVRLQLLVLKLASRRGCCWDWGRLFRCVLCLDLVPHRND
jgi:hypothetical protein